MKLPSPDTLSLATIEELYDNLDIERLQLLDRLEEISSDMQYLEDLRKTKSNKTQYKEV